MLKYHIWTIGCQMNKAESERLGSYLEELGYEATTSTGDAELIVLNSCVVRQNAENRAINKLHTLKALKREKPELVLALTGCLVNSDNAYLQKRFPHVDYFFKAGNYPQWLGKAERAQSLPQQPPPAQGDGSPTP